MKTIEEVNTGSIRLVTIYGDSSETKPTHNISDGSLFIETDTTKKFIFNEKSTLWKQIKCSGNCELITTLMNQITELNNRITALEPSEPEV